MKDQQVQPWVNVPPGTLHSWGVDYLRATTDNEAGKRAILTAWETSRAQLERLGDTVKPGGMQGFKGERCGALFYGRSATHFMLQASGQLADALFPKLPWATLHCTRIDVQVTLQYEQDHAALAQWLGRRRAEPFRVQNEDPCPIQALIVGYGHGDTLSIGSRSSPRYGRIYDKGREDKDERYARCWRFEIEYKDPVADKVVEFLRHSPSLDRAVAGAVAGQLADWGIRLDVPAEAVLVGGSVGRREFDLERSVKWLESQVAPTCERLLAHLDREEILVALGLSEATDRRTSAAQRRPITPDQAATLDTMDERAAWLDHLGHKE